MPNTDLLKGKKVLIVDDEPDILEVLEELLDMCEVVKASTFEQASRLLESEDFHITVLDIMGVRGFDLLDIATKKKIPALMLTAHGLNPDNLVGSIKLGAKSYIPKDKIGDLALYLTDLFRAQERGVEESGNWFARLSEFFDARFGHGWKNKDKKFWKEFDKTYKVSKDELEKLL